MGQTERIVVTRREALGILRIRRVSLPYLERAAEIHACADRAGYTAGEFKRLVGLVRRALAR